ncbi:hypothetical protein [Rhodovastum atsumiense]|nr:hypothetical protein [Rhodovastum atsumiense]
MDVEKPERMAQDPAQKPAACLQHGPAAFPDEYRYNISTVLD